jgi:hypothetical protein
MISPTNILPEHQNKTWYLLQISYQDSTIRHDLSFKYLTKTIDHVSLCCFGKICVGDIMSYCVVMVRYLEERSYLTKTAQWDMISPTNILPKQHDKTWSLLQISFQDSTIRHDCAVLVRYLEEITCLIVLSW